MISLGGFWSFLMLHASGSHVSFARLIKPLLQTRGHIRMQVGMTSVSPYFDCAPTQVTLSSGKPTVCSFKSTTSFYSTAVDIVLPRMQKKPIIGRVRLPRDSPRTIGSDSGSTFQV